MLPPDGDRNAGFQKDFQSYRSLEGKAFLVYGLSLIFFFTFLEVLVMLCFKREDEIACSMANELSVKRHYTELAVLQSHPASQIASSFCNRGGNSGNAKLQGFKTDL